MRLQHTTHPAADCGVDAGKRAPGLGAQAARLQFAAQFFDTIRDQTATAFYTTPQGWKDLGYIGNVAMPKFEGPNAEIRRKIGVE